MESLSFSDDLQLIGFCAVCFALIAAYVKYRTWRDDQHEEQVRQRREKWAREEEERKLREQQAQEAKEEERG